jgi:hypothetical protein
LRYLPELDQPAGALFVTKTACDAFYHTRLKEAATTYIRSL